MYDTIIIGAGPSGLTAAIYLLRSNKKVLIFESESIGGQIASSPLVENYPGFIKISGSEFANNLYEQVINLDGEIELEKVVEIKPNTKEVVTEDNTYKAKTIIVATGAKYRLLGISKEEEFIGNGISFCTTCDGAFYKNKDVAVIGGGSSAVTNALYLSTLCNKVYLIHRNENFRCEKTLLDKAKSTKNIEILMNYNIEKYLGEECLTGIIIKNITEEKEIKLDGLFLSVGHVPQNELANNLLNLSDNKYILSNENCETNIEGIYVIGDVRDKKVRQLTTAVSDGTIAAINIIKYLDQK